MTTPVFVQTALRDASRALECHILARLHPDTPASTVRLLCTLADHAAVSAKVRPWAERHGVVEDTIRSQFVRVGLPAPKAILSDLRAGLIADFARATGLGSTRVAEVCGFSSVQAMLIFVRRVSGCGWREFCAEWSLERALNRQFSPELVERYQTAHLGRGVAWPAPEAPNA